MPYKQAQTEAAALGSNQNMRPLLPTDQSAGTWGKKTPNKADKYTAKKQSARPLDMGESVPHALEGRGAHGGKNVKNTCRRRVRPGPIWGR